MTVTSPPPQVQRIARLLGVAVTEVHGLDSVPDEDLRVLHAQISNTLFGRARRRFARVAALSKSVPAPIAGRLAEKFLPPVMAARVAELLEPDKARDLVGRVSVAYLADLATALDPVRSQPVLQAIPARQAGEVARELFGRHEYATMAEFAGSVRLDALFAALDAAAPHDLLAVVPLLDWNDNLDRVIAELPDKQIEQIVADLDATELAELALALDPSRFGPIVHAVPLDTVAAIAAVLFQRGEHASMASLAGVVTKEMLSAALGLASSRDLLIVAPLLTWNDNVDHAIHAAPTTQINGVVAEIVAGQMWVEGDYLMDRLGHHNRERLLAALRDTPDDTFNALSAAARDGKLGSTSAELLAEAAEQRS
jgi:hypothetical protein